MVNTRWVFFQLNRLAKCSDVKTSTYVDITLGIDSGEDV